MTILCRGADLARLTLEGTVGAEHDDGLLAVCHGNTLHERIKQVQI